MLWGARLCSAPGVMTSYSPGKAHEEPDTKAVPHLLLLAEPVITQASVLLGFDFPCAFLCVTAKNSSRLHEFAHSLLLGLWLAGVADNTCSLASSVLAVLAEHCWWRSWSWDRAAWAAAAAVAGVWHMISLRVCTHPTSCSSKKVPPEPATGV